VNVLLCAGASVAIYKACDLASKLAQDGHAVKCVLTPAAAKLVSPQLFEAVSGEPAFVEEFGDARRGAMDHIALTDWGELLLVAPASADLVARLALGLAGDLVGTVALAWHADRPRLLCPAMNPNMLAAGPIARHLETLRGDGWSLMEPEEGHMACGVSGKGRLPEPEAIRRRLTELARSPRRAPS
jgi:phosphopantothenoylcysteine decarboxylase/phosphopantothenate--cysteine ligase